MFSFLLIEDSRCAEEGRKEKTYAIMIDKTISGYIITPIQIRWLCCRKAYCYLFSFPSKENKSKTKLCVLRVSAVNRVLSETL